MNDLAGRIGHDLLLCPLSLHTEHKRRLVPVALTGDSVAIVAMGSGSW